MQQFPRFLSRGFTKPKMITLKKIVICTGCRGEGKVKVGNLREMHNHDIETCNDCGGKGTLRRIVTIQYEKI